MSSQLTPQAPQDKLAKTIKLIGLALPEVGAKLNNSNQKDQTLNLLLSVNDDADIAKISSVIWSVEAMLKSTDISIVKLYRTLAGESKSEYFSTLDLNKPLLDTNQEDPFSQDSLPDQDESNLTTSITLQATPEVNPNLGLKQRAKLGDIQAIKQLLDIALIYRNATTIVRLEDKILRITVESEQEPNQQTVVLAIKRQLELLKSSVFDTAKVNGKTKSETEVWTENISLAGYFKTDETTFSKIKTEPKKAGVSWITKNHGRQIIFKLLDQQINFLRNRIDDRVLKVFMGLLLLLLMWNGYRKLDPVLAAEDAVKVLESATYKGVNIDEYNSLVFSTLQKVEQIPNDKGNQKIRLAKTVAFHALALKLWECDYNVPSVYICKVAFYLQYISDRYSLLKTSDFLALDVGEDSGGNIVGHIFSQISTNEVIQKLWQQADQAKSSELSPEDCYKLQRIDLSIYLDNHEYNFRFLDSYICPYTF